MNSQSLQHLFHCALLYSHGVLITKINTARLNRTAKTENMAHYESSYKLYRCYEPFKLP